MVQNTVVRVLFIGKRVLAVVPARGGSKGLPKKNLRKVGGVSLVGRAGVIASSLKWLDKAVLSTDSAEIASEGRKYGLDVPFIRPDDLAGDHVGPVPVMQHAVRECEGRLELTFDVIVLMEPTCPLRRPDDVERVVQCLIESGSDSAFCVSPIPHNHHPAKAFALRDGKMEFYMPETEAVPNRQSLPEAFFRNGAAYAVTRECLMDRDSLFGEDMRGIVVQRILPHVDYLEDIEYAESVLRREKALPYA